jgi:imidazolonepropionase-like amidohydrolase
LTGGGLRPADFAANLQRAIESGLSHGDALAALSREPAEIFGAGDQIGTLEAGKIANVVVTSAELLSRDPAIRHMFIDGVEVELRKPEPERTRPAPQRGSDTGTGGMQ